MLLRNANLSDVDRIMDILADGRLSLAMLGVDQWQGYYPHEGIIVDDVNSHASYVIEDGEGRLAATVMIGLEGEEDYLRIEGGEWLTDSPLDNPSYAVIHRMAVAADSRGSGVARYILSEAEAIAASLGYQSIRIDTHPDNVPMNKLLERAGYHYCGIIYIAHAEGFAPERCAFEKLIGFPDVIVQGSQILDRVGDR